MLLNDDRFEPARFSVEELLFVLEHLEKPPIAALHKGAPKGVNPKAIENLLGRLYQLEELRRHENVVWAGYDQVRDAIERYLSWHERTLEIRRRGGPRHASQFVWDSDGRPIKFGIGSDSSAMVRTEILADGSRKPFGVNLRIPEGGLLSNLAEVAPWLRGTNADPGTRPAPPKDTLQIAVKGKHGTVTCSVCGYVETFDARSNITKNQARARMARHLKTAREDINRHRLLYTREFPK